MTEMKPEQQFYSGFHPDTNEPVIVIMDYANQPMVEIYKDRVQSTNRFMVYKDLQPLTLASANDVVIRGVSPKDLLDMLVKSKAIFDFGDRRKLGTVQDKVYYQVKELAQLSEAETVFTTTVSNSRLEIPLKIGEKVEVLFDVDGIVKWREPK